MVQMVEAGSEGRGSGGAQAGLPESFRPVARAAEASTTGNVAPYQACPCPHSMQRTKGSPCSLQKRGLKRGDQITWHQVFAGERKLKSEPRSIDPRPLFCILQNQAVPVPVLPPQVSCFPGRLLLH